MIQARAENVFPHGVAAVGQHGRSHEIQIRHVGKHCQMHLRIVGQRIAGFQPGVFIRWMYFVIRHEDPLNLSNVDCCEPKSVALHFGPASGDFEVDLTFPSQRFRRWYVGHRQSVMQTVFGFLPGR